MFQRGSWSSLITGQAHLYLKSQCQYKPWPAPDGATRAQGGNWTRRGRRRSSPRLRKGSSLQQKPLCYKAGMLSFIPGYVFWKASAGPVPGGGLRRLGHGEVLLSSPNKSTTQQKLGRGRLGVLQALRLARPRRPRGLHGNPCPPAPSRLTPTIHRGLQETTAPRRPCGEARLPSGQCGSPSPPPAP